MKCLEHRRHTMRIKPGIHLSQEGIDLAKRIGSTMGPFRKVVTSTVPRAIETALVFGFTVDEMVEELSTLGPTIDEEIGSGSFKDISIAIQKNGATAKYGQMQLNLFNRILSEIEEGECALVVSHGCIVEIGLVTMIPDADHSTWGRPFDYCEGFRVEVEDVEYVNVELLRVDCNQPKKTRH